MPKKHIALVAPPLPLPTLKAYAKEIFAPIKRGESVSTVWVAMAGRRVRNKYIIANPQLFKEEMGDKQYLLVYIEALELTENSALGFFKLTSQSIIESFKESYPGKKLSNSNNYYHETGDYPDLLNRLKVLVREINDQGLEIVLFIGEFDELSFADNILYNNLKSVWNRTQGGLHFVFLLQKDLTRPEYIAEYGDLNALLLKNVIYIPLLDQLDIDYLFDLFSRELKYIFSNEERDLITKVCGGHPYLIHSCCRLIALVKTDSLSLEEKRQLILTHFEPRSAASKLFDLLPEDVKLHLQNLVQKSQENLPSELGTLKRLRVVDKVQGHWLPFGDLFTSVIEEKTQKLLPGEDQNDGVKFEISDGVVFIAGTNVEDKFTKQEYEVLRFLLNDPEKLRSRDEIGEAMWGKLTDEKYSDWAIDQAMSKIRKKLKNLGADNYLVTVRGRGYKLSLDKAA